jgi:hypothetical protein
MGKIGFTGSGYGKNRISLIRVLEKRDFLAQVIRKIG